MFLFGAMLTILYLFRAFDLVFLGEAKGLLAKEGSIVMVLCVASFALLSLLGGIFINYPNRVIQTMITQIMSGIR
jgi:NADH:ubiquinone oxidoreductase subunit 5 (subunit L)/multisubunit Na+/H+ antiporter MnhA subunit